jgi:hypothetical protein
LKSLIISSPDELTNEEWTFIFENPQFLHLDSLKIKESNHYLLNSTYDVVKNVLNSENCLKTFSCSMIIPSLSQKSVINLLPNLTLHSLTLTVSHFEYLFSLFEFTPNLTYLNVQIESTYGHPDLRKEIKINLKEFYLKLGIDEDMLISLDPLIRTIKLFSSSLICLSLDLASGHLTGGDTLNCLKLQQFLESIKELQQFHFYAKFNSNINQNFLSNFENEFWFDHNWPFGIYGKYFFTLPFHFNHLHEFPNSFNYIKSQILDTNSRIWFNVKSLELSMTHQYDFNFVKELKIKMPKLN